MIKKSDRLAVLDDELEDERYLAQIIECVEADMGLRGD
jgi:hypothetical protein